MAGTDSIRRSSQEKMLGLLDAFSDDSPLWSAEDLIARSGLTASTCYRYLKSLHSAGLLARVGSGSYAIGPRVLELDRVSRLSDPIFSMGKPVIRSLAQRTGFSALLSILYSDSVMCVQQEPAGEVPAGLFGRGQRRPLVAGATANVILAHLPHHQLRAVFGKHRDAIERARLGTDWDTFRSSLRAIRQQGHAYSAGEYRPGIAGLAAPLFNREGDVLGSIALATSTGSPRLAEFRTLAPAVIEAAARISHNIGESARSADLPARALG